MENTISLVSLVKKQNEEEVVGKIKNVIAENTTSGIKESPQIGHPKQIPNHSLITFDIPTSNALQIIVNLTIDGVPIVSEEPFIKNAVKEGRFQLEQQKAEAIHQIGKQKPAKKEKELTPNELAEMGNWRVLATIANNKSLHNAEKNKKVIELLPDVLQRIIEHESLRGLDKIKFAGLSIEKLFPISTSSSLKTLGLTDQMQEAGESAIKICAKYPKNFLTELISLTNSDKTVPYLNLKAFTAFYMVVKENTEEYKHDITNAVKKINTRALSIKSQVVFNLTKEEKDNLEKGINFFDKKRKEL